MPTPVVAWLLLKQRRGQNTENGAKAFKNQKKYSRNLLYLNTILK